MTDELKLTGAEIAATRHLIGLTQQELADELGVSRHAVKDWESGRFSARAGVVSDLLHLRGAHDVEARRLIKGALDGIPIHLPRGPKPQGWYLALGARVLAVEVDAMLEWADG